MSYISGERRDGCVLCLSEDETDDATRLVLFRGTSVYAILNLYPYNTGHLMVVPYDHVATLEGVPAQVRHEMLDVVSRCVAVGRRVFRCDGFNIGMNIGETAGAGIAGHMHMHVVPRWTGDANFMPILGQTMVLPELLPVTYARLRAELEVERARDEGAYVAQAGAVVVLPASGQVVLRRSPTGEIVLPKGHIEVGETAVEAALREVSEETGVDAALAGWAGTSTFSWTTRRGVPEDRFVAYVIATGVGSVDASRERDDVVFVPVDTAADALSVPALRHMVQALTPILRELCGGQG